MKFLMSLMRSKRFSSNSAVSYARKGHKFVDTYIISKRFSLGGGGGGCRINFFSRIVSKSGFTQAAKDISALKISHKTNLFTYYKRFNLLHKYVCQKMLYFRVFGSKTGFEVSQAVDNTLCSLKNCDKIHFV